MIESTHEFINLEYLDLMADGDTSMRQVLLEMLLTELPVELNKMRVLLDQQDWGELREVSHKMKSTLPFIGNKSLIEANKEIERRSKEEEDLQGIPHLLQVLESAYPNVELELKRELANIQ